MPGGCCRGCRVCPAGRTAAAAPCLGGWCRPPRPAVAAALAGRPAGCADAVLIFSRLHGSGGVARVWVWARAGCTHRGGNTTRTPLLLQRRPFPPPSAAAATALSPPSFSLLSLSLSLAVIVSFAAGPFFAGVPLAWRDSRLHWRVLPSHRAQRPLSWPIRPRGWPRSRPPLCGTGPLLGGRCGRRPLLLALAAVRSLAARRHGRPAGRRGGGPLPPQTSPARCRRRRL